MKKNLLSKNSTTYKVGELLVTSATIGIVGIGLAKYIDLIKNVATNLGIVLDSATNATLTSSVFVFTIGSYYIGLGTICFIVAPKVIKSIKTRINNPKNKSNTSSKQLKNNHEISKSIKNINARQETITQQNYSFKTITQEDRKNFLMKELEFLKQLEACEEQEYSEEIGYQKYLRQ